MKNIRKIVDSTKSLIFPAIILLLLIFVIQPENMVGTISYLQSQRLYSDKINARP